MGASPGSSGWKVHPTPLMACQGGGCRAPGSSSLSVSLAGFGMSRHTGKLTVWRASPLLGRPVRHVCVATSPAAPAAEAPASGTCADPSRSGRCPHRRQGGLWLQNPGGSLPASCPAVTLAGRNAKDDLAPSRPNTAHRGMRFKKSQKGRGIRQRGWVGWDGRVVVEPPGPLSRDSLLGWKSRQMRPGGRGPP